MKINKHLIIASTMALGLNGAVALGQDEGSSDFGQVNKEAKELLAALGEYGASQRDEAMEATEETLDKLDRSIEEMEHNMREEWDSMDAAARKKGRESMAALRRKRTELAEWYGAMKNSSSGAWDDMKQGFSEAYQSMGEAWDNALEEFED